MKAIDPEFTLFEKCVRGDASDNTLVHIQVQDLKAVRTKLVSRSI